MAEKVTLVDDLDGTDQGVSRMTFALNGEQYEIDLSEENASELRAAVARFTEVARPLHRTAVPTRRSPARRSGVSKKAPTNSPSAREIRAWAKKKRIKVNDKGIVPSSVRERYLAENPH